MQADDYRTCYLVIRPYRRTNYLFGGRANDLDPMADVIAGARLTKGLHVVPHAESLQVIWNAVQDHYVSHLQRACLT